MLHLLCRTVWNWSLYIFISLYVFFFLHICLMLLINWSATGTDHIHHTYIGYWSIDPPLWSNFSKIWISKLHVEKLLWKHDMDTQIARFMGPTWDPPGADRTQVGPVLAPWTLLSGYAFCITYLLSGESTQGIPPVTGGFPHKQTKPKQLLSKQSSFQWLETPCCSCDFTVMVIF